MCNLSEYYEERAARKERIKMIQKMIERGDSKDAILELGVTEDEYTEAANQSLQFA